MRFAHYALRPEVLELEYGNSTLSVELRRLGDVAEVDAPDAAIFYSARVLEGLTSRAATEVVGTPSANAFGNLMLLSETGFLAESSASLMHALRRLGNDARHGLVSHETKDSDLALALLERTLAWYFVHGALGPRLPSLTVGEELVLGSEERSLLKVVDASSSSDIALEVRPHMALLESSPVLSGLVAESWIRVGGEGPRCGLDLLDRVLVRYPRDPRLLQLRAWALRLTGRETDSIEGLEALIAAGREDDETLGLLAGGYKRSWVRTCNPQDLRRAAALYARAWKRSGRRSVYAGVNAAAMALLTGEPERSRSIASAVTALYEARRGRFAPGNTIAFTGYWDLVSLAEAELLSGDVERARARFAQAFSRYADRPTHVASTEFQLSLIVAALDLESEPARWLRATAPMKESPRASMKTYEPRPLSTLDVALSEDLREAAERLAEHVHDTWAQRRISEGWQLGERRDDEARTHPNLVPYTDLPESEKEYDRQTALETIRVLVKMGYRIVR